MLLPHQELGPPKLSRQGEAWAGDLRKGLWVRRGYWASGLISRVSEAERRNLSGLWRNQHPTPILKDSSKKGNLAAESSFQRNPTEVSGSFDAFQSLSSVKWGWWWINNEGEMLLGQLKQTFHPPGDPFGYHGNNCGKQKSRWHSLTWFKCKFCG